MVKKKKLRSNHLFTSPEIRSLLKEVKKSIFTLQEIADVVGVVSHATIINWIKQGAMPTTKYAVLRRFMDKNKVETNGK